MQPTQEPGKITLKTLQSVVQINQRINSSSISTGTGFIIENKEKNQFFLITNKHVIGEWDPPEYIFHKYNGTFSFFVYTSSTYKEIQMNLNDGLSNKLEVHPNRFIDVAIIDITEALASDKSILRRSFDVSDLIDFKSIYSDYYFGVGDIVYAIGYPHGIRSVNNNLPIAKSICIASIPGNEFYFDLNEKSNQAKHPGKVIIADGYLVKGNSGGPVIMPLGSHSFKYSEALKSIVTNEIENNYIIGIVSNSRNKKIQIPVKSKSTELQKKNSDCKDQKYVELIDYSGINVIFSADYIKEAIALFD